MGKIKKGILGGFNGRVGNVIGASWKGIAYMRSEAQSIKDPKTTKQLEQRSIFGVTSDFVSRNLSLFNVGFQEQAIKKSAFNAAVKTNVLRGVFSYAVVEQERELVYEGEACVLSKGSYSLYFFATLGELANNVVPLNVTLDQQFSESDAPKIHYVVVNVDDAEVPFVSGSVVAEVRPSPQGAQVINISTTSLAHGTRYGVFCFLESNDGKTVTDSLYVDVFSTPD